MVMIGKVEIEINRLKIIVGMISSEQAEAVIDGLVGLGYGIPAAKNYKDALVLMVSEQTSVETLALIYGLTLGMRMQEKSQKLNSRFLILSDDRDGSLV